MAKKVLLVAVFAVHIGISPAQYLPASNTDSILSCHLQTINNLTDSLLYNPDDYITGKLHNTRGNKDNHPYFLDYNWKPGLVKYKDKLFNIPMIKYDIENDGLVVLKIIKNLVYSIQLNNTLIQEFSIEGHHFCYLDSIRIPGWYEEIYNSDQTKVWAKWTKRSKVDANSVSGIPVYISDLHVFIQKNNSYYKAENPKEILRVFSDRKQELRNYKRVNNLSYGKDKPGTVKKMAEQYDILTH